MDQRNSHKFYYQNNNLKNLITITSSEVNSNKIEDISVQRVKNVIDEIGL